MLHTVRAEIITELILERAGPVISKYLFTGINRFRTDSTNFSCKKSKAWKLLETKSTVIFEIITFLIQKHFKTVTVTVILKKLIQMTFLDGNWESMEMKGRLRAPRR